MNTYLQGGDQVKQKLILHIQNLSRHKIVLVLCCSIAPSVLLIFLIKFDFLKWNAEFKLADFVGIIVALLTLWAIYISSKAAKSAQVSAEIARDAAFHTEQQTILLKEQYERSISPKLIPSTIQINRDFLSITDFGDSSFGDNISVSVKNVGKGNAYYIHTWIELDEVNRFLDGNITSGFGDDGALGTFHYSLKFQYGNDYYYPMIFVRQLKKYDDVRRQITNKTFYIEYNTIPHPSLNENESMDFSIPEYVKVLFGDIIFNGPRLKNLPKKSEDLSYKFTLYIKYQTDLQLGTKTQSVSKFALILNNIKYETGSHEGMSMTAGFIPKGTETINEELPIS